MCALLCRRTERMIGKRERRAEGETGETETRGERGAAHSLLGMDSLKFKGTNTGFLSQHRHQNQISVNNQKCTL